MDGGPWLFRGSPVIMEEYDGFSNIHEYKLNKIPVWAQIHGTPEGLMKKKELAEKVASRLGKPPITVIVNERKINPTPYLRARVFLLVEKVLVRVVQITLREKRNYLVQYEKLHVFCNFCDIMGHEVAECGDGVHTEEECEWGDWLLVKFEGSRGNRGPTRGGGARGGTRGRGRGRGRGAPGDAPDEDMEESEEQLDHNQNLCTQRKRVVGDGEDLQVTDPTMVNVSNRVAAKVLMIEGA